MQIEWSEREVLQLAGVSARNVPPKLCIVARIEIETLGGAISLSQKRAARHCRCNCNFSDLATFENAATVSVFTKSQASRYA
jgi:hypothetical protein